MLDRLKRRWRALFRKEEFERELEAELRFHLEREAELNLRAGMNPEDAHYAALKSFGPMERSKEECRDARGSLRIVICPLSVKSPGLEAIFQSRGSRVTNRSRIHWSTTRPSRPTTFVFMEIPLLRGRVFTDRDTVRPDNHRDVAIVSKRLAERLWPNADPLGKRVNCHDDGAGCAEIVGVVGDVKHNSLVDEAGYDFYYSCYQSYAKQTHFVARTHGDPMALAKEIQRAVWRVSPDTGIFNVMPVTRLSANTIWQSRVWGLLLAIFSGIALVLATAGIYGVMAFFVTSAHARDWCSNRPRRAVARRTKADPEEWHVARKDRSDDWPCRRACVNASNDDLAV